VKVVLAAPTVPVGSYARATFGKLSGQNGYPADFPAAVEKNVVSNELDVKAIVTKISLDEADAGVVYSTDVTPVVAPKLDVVPFPAAVNPDIEYPIAALKSAPNAKAAQAFVDFVLSPEGQAFLKARGFISP
jgi:molybdate transport system substrate-binding protein